MFHASRNLAFTSVNDPSQGCRDFIRIVEGESSAEVFIFQSKYRESTDNCHKTIYDAEVLKVWLFLNELLDKA